MDLIFSGSPFFWNNDVDGDDDDDDDDNTKGSTDKWELSAGQKILTNIPNEYCAFSSTQISVLLKLNS